MNNVPGTEGYDHAAHWFIECSQALNFHEVCKDFLGYLPSTPARILDVGAGAGQNAAALAELGYSVTAVEPMAKFLTAARTKYSNFPITWLAGSLPALECLKAEKKQFDFILVVGVWHHLNEEEQALAMKRLASLLGCGGQCAITLRNGPPGMGTRVYSTDAGQTIKQAKDYGLECILKLENQPSILGNKEGVKWARLVLQKR